MKTLFITAFEGVEVKNLLRTPVLETLLAEPDLRVIALVKSEERMRHYSAEFRHERLVFAVAPYARTLGRGWDRFFATLKYLLLRTETTDLRRRMLFEQHQSRVRYYGSMWLNYLLAWPWVRRLARFLDHFLVRNDAYCSLFDQYRPDAVLVAHLFEEPEIHLLRDARRRGIATIGLINSWDKVTTRCAIRLLPDRVIVFNETMRDEMIRYNEMPKHAIMISGLPQYDVYACPCRISREDFFAARGMDPARKLVVYAAMGSTFSNADWATIDLLHALNDKKAFGDRLELLVRFAPNDRFDEDELKKRPRLRYDYPGTRYSAGRGVDWDMNGHDIDVLHATLVHLSLLISYPTSLSVDAAVFDKPLINIFFETSLPESLMRSPLQYYGFTHYQKALATGGIRLVRSEAELIEWMSRYLQHPETDRDARARLVHQQCQYTDGKSGERIGTFIRNYLYER